MADFDKVSIMSGGTEWAVLSFGTEENGPPNGGRMICRDIDGRPMAGTQIVTDQAPQDSHGHVWVRSGLLEVQDRTGKRRAAIYDGDPRMGEAGGKIELHAALPPGLSDKPAVIIDATTRTFVLHNFSGIPSVKAEGQLGKFTCMDAEGHPIVSLNAKPGTVSAGGGGHDGFVECLDKNGKQAVLLAGIGVVGVGGNGHDGQVICQNAAGHTTVILDGMAGDIRLSGADCAEQFPVADAEKVSPGTVLVATDDGTFEPCGRPYDHRVVGIVSGAGALRPGIRLNATGTGENEVPVALIGRVYCRVDATEHPVSVGDMLVASGTPGHAMKAADAGRAFGAVIGKALSPLSGVGLIPVLVTLQ